MSEGFKNPFTSFGEKVKVKLVILGRTQEWLIKEVAKNTGMFIDSSLLNKVLTGRVNSKRIISAIDEIIGPLD